MKSNMGDVQPAIKKKRQYLKQLSEKSEPKKKQMKNINVRTVGRKSS